jgi:hypothetical protein
MRLQNNSFWYGSRHNHVMTPELKRLFVDILLRESALLDIIDEQENVLHDFILSEFYAETGSYHAIADYLGIPSDVPFCLSEEGCGKSECRHGVKLYCRDWITEAMNNGAKDYEGDCEEARFESLLDAMIDSADRCKGIDYGPCVQCEMAFATAG